MRRGYIILSGVGLILIWTGACCMDSEGIAFAAAVGMMFIGALVAGCNLLEMLIEQKRRRTEREKKTKRDNLFNNWINCDIRPHMGAYHITD